MSYQSQKIFFVLMMIFSSTMSQEKYNPLNGKHLRIIAYEFGKALFYKRNSSTHIVEIDGVLFHHIETLTKMYNFSYAFITEIALPLDDTPTKKGTITFMNNGGADYCLTSALGTSSRSKVADIPASWFEGSYYCIVPYPQKEINPTASLKPLSLQAWILVFASALAIIISLHLLVNKRLLQWQTAIARKPSTVANDIGGGINSFVWGNLVSQGQSFSSTRLVVRFVGGSWCVGCFFLVQIYCSTLTSHLTSPNRKPIVSSIYELAHSSKVSITEEWNVGLTSVILNAESGNVKLLGDKIRRNPSLLRNSTADCLEMVKKDRYTAYCNSMNGLNSILSDDLKKMGTCQYLLINDILTSYSTYSFLPKNSPYTEIISRGTLRMKESGLYPQWWSWYSPSSWQCKSIIIKEDKALQKLSLKHLTSAFVILCCGLLMAIAAFTLENLTRTFGK